jgi:hypothetical protein
VTPAKGEDAAGGDNSANLVVAFASGGADGKVILWNSSFVPVWEHDLTATDGATLTR